jgi:hypothetical protein
MIKARSRKQLLYRATEKPSPYWIKIKNIACDFGNARPWLFPMATPNQKLVQVGTVSPADALSGLSPGSFKVTGVSSDLDSNPNIPKIVITPDGSGGYVIQLQADRWAREAGDCIH